MKISCFFSINFGKNGMSSRCFVSFLIYKIKIIATTRKKSEGKSPLAYTTGAFRVLKRVLGRERGKRDTRGGGKTLFLVSISSLHARASKPVDNPQRPREKNSMAVPEKCQTHEFPRVYPYEDQKRLKSAIPTII